MQPSESTPSASQTSSELKHDSRTSADSSPQLGIQVLSRFFLESPALGVRNSVFLVIEMLLDASRVQVIKFIKVRNAREMKGSFWNPFSDFDSTFDDAAVSKWHMRWQWSLAALLADLVGSLSLRHQRLVQIECDRMDWRWLKICCKMMANVNIN